jgi:hypothetical protein
MIAIPGFMKRKRPDPSQKDEGPAEKPAEPLAGRPRRFMGGSPESTQDLLTIHDGERVGFRKPVQG